MQLRVHPEGGNVRLLPCLVGIKARTPSGPAADLRFERRIGRHGFATIRAVDALVSDMLYLDDALIMRIVIPKKRRRREMFRCEI